MSLPGRLVQGLRRRWRQCAAGRWILLAPGALLGGLAACSALPQTGPPAGPLDLPPSEDQAGPGGAAIAALDFPIILYQGGDRLQLRGTEVRFAQLFASGKPVVLNFWAGLCPPCRVEMPDLEAMHREYQDRVVLFGLDVGPFVGLGSNEDGRKLLKELKVTFPAGTTPDAQVARRYELQGMPTTVFITPQGQVVQKWTGLLTRGKLKELVEKLLAASEPA